MTRTRTQTTLTKLASMVANVHGELAFVERLLEERRAASTAPVVGDSGPALMQKSRAMQRQMTSAMAKDAARANLAEKQVQTLERRRQELLAIRSSLYATVKQFDPGLDPADIGSDDAWLKQFGRGGGKTAVGRYLRTLPAVD